MALMKFNLSQLHLPYFVTERAPSDPPSGLYCFPQKAFEKSKGIACCQSDRVDICCWHLMGRRKSAKLSTVSRAISWKEEFFPSNITCPPKKHWTIAFKRERRHIASVSGKGIYRLPSHRWRPLLLALSSYILACPPPKWQDPKQC